jgi:hypothetical protein
MSVSYGYLGSFQVFSTLMKSDMINPIELAWSGLKNYVRDRNVSFNLSDVRHLTYQWMTSLHRLTVVGYYQ